MPENTLRLALAVKAGAIELPPSHVWVPEERRSPIAPRLRAVPVALALILLVAGGAYALPVLLPSVFGLNDPSAVEILQSGHATELGLTRVASGVTITLDRAYVGQDRVVVQFTIPSPPADPGQTVPSPVTTGGSLVLTDSQGRNYAVLRGQESPILEGARWKGEALIGVYSFDASNRPTDADTILLRFTIHELRGVPSSRLPNTPMVTVVRGPWEFDFEVPISR